MSSGESKQSNRLQRQQRVRGRHDKKRLVRLGRKVASDAIIASLHPCFDVPHTGIYTTADTLQTHLSLEERDEDGEDAEEREAGQEEERDNEERRVLLVVWCSLMHTCTTLAHSPTLLKNLSIKR